MRNRIHALVAVMAVIMSAPGLTVYAQQSPGPLSWNGWQFLIGEWVGEGSGAPGQGTGGFTFSWDLQNTVLVRRNFAKYPATADKPAYDHDDLMIIYYEKDTPRAVYFDNERHIIHYTVSFAADSSSIVFLSDPVPSAPRYRLTYSKKGGGNVGIAFDIARPDKPDEFSHYIEAMARRK